ncbi:MAG: SyrP protein [Gammaproteobacteria bacterium]|nr:SyrP protein [Gammaproteobacteria bacterium]
MTNQPFLQEVENDSGLNNLKSTQDWLKENKIFIELKLEEHGAIIFKDLPVKTAEDFDQFVSTFNYETFTYEESLSNAVRINKTDKVFTANEAPREVEIFLHHEMAQTPTYPKNIFFFCKSASETGGETPLCRSDQLYEALLKADKALVESFEKFGVIYNSIMSSGDELISGQGRSWQKTLGVSSKNDAEEKLSKLGYSWNWIEDDNLSVTTKTLQATKELGNGQKSFFNQVIAASLGWKKNSENQIAPVRFGNGEEIKESYIELLSELAQSLTLLRSWQDHDILLIDNYRVMHGRKPFAGNKNREVLVSLTN